MVQNDLILDFNLYLCEKFGYKHLCTESDDYKYYQMLGLILIHKGLFGQYNYGLPMKDLNV